MTVRNPTFAIPDLTNATEGFLVDEIAKARAMMNWLKRLEAVHKEVLYSRIGSEPGDKRLEGERFVMTGISKVSTERLNTEKIRAEMDTEWLQKYSTLTSYNTLNLEAKETTIGHEELQQWLKNLDAELFS